MSAIPFPPRRPRTAVRARRFCTACGKPTEPVPDTFHRRCTACGEIEYLNPAPAVGIAVVRAGKVLLSKRARPPKQGEWDLVGGFVDAGETPLAAARREAREETSCALRDVRVRKILPGDYDGQPTLNFLVTGDLEGKPVAADDSLELRWFSLKRLPPLAWPHEAELLRGLVEETKPTRE